MTRFLKRTLLFILLFSGLVILTVLVITLLNKRLLDQYPLNHVTTIFIGDSHMEMGLNDQLFPNSVNLAKSSDGYIHTYAKLKAVMKSNPQIRNVVLSYSPHNLSSYFNTFIVGRDARYGFADYFPILPAAERRELLRRNKLLGIKALSLILTNGFTNLVADSNRYSFLGRFSPRPFRLKDTSTIMKRIDVQFYEQGRLRPVSSLQKLYLEKIIDLCFERDIKLVLIKMPVHRVYRNLVPKEYRDEYFSNIRNKPVLLFDCIDLHLPDASFLPDGDHVNAEGADSTTKFIYQRLNSLHYLRK